MLKLVRQAHWLTKTTEKLESNQIDLKNGLLDYTKPTDEAVNLIFNTMSSWTSSTTFIVEFKRKFECMWMGMLWPPLLKWIGDVEKIKFGKKTRRTTTILEFNFTFWIIFCLWYPNASQKNEIYNTHVPFERAYHGLLKSIIDFIFKFLAKS